MGEGSHIYKLNGQVLHRERGPRRARSDEVRPRGPLDGPVGSERRSAKTRAWESARATGCGTAATRAAVRNHAAESGRAREPDAAPGRHRRHGDRRMVGLLHAGPQLGRPPHLAFAGHVGGRLALLRPAREISTRTPKTWVKPNTGARRAGDVAIRSQRRLLQAEAPAGLAMESSAGRHEVVADGASGLSAPALAARRAISGGRETR